MQGSRKRPSKKCASLRRYTPQHQLKLACYEPDPMFSRLDKTNRWVVLSDKIPWDDVVHIFYSFHPQKSTGRKGLNPRIIIGAVIIKHFYDYQDREVIEQIRENAYLQYFIGLEGFMTDPPFDSSLFVEIRHKLTPSLLERLSERLLGIVEKPLLTTCQEEPAQDDTERLGNGPKDNDQGGQQEKPTHKGDLLLDATVAPQAIGFPTDLNLLHQGRQMSEKIIDALMAKKKKDVKMARWLLALFEKPTTMMEKAVDRETEMVSLQAHISKLEALSKPRTYRQIARKDYLKTAQNKNPSKKVLRKAKGKQLNYLKRNLGHIQKMLALWEGQPYPLDEVLENYLEVITTLYAQQKEMFEERKNKVDNRIVSIHQPHVRPMVRGKAKAKTEFGAKLHLSLIDGFSFLDTISWDAFNEGKHLEEYVENYKTRFGYYPARVLADKLYCTRANRKWLKERGILLRAKPLGRPSSVKAVANHVSPGERNPIEGKFGQAKTAYGMGRIRAKLKQTSQSWIASIVLVLNLVNFTRVAPYGPIFSYFRRFSSDARRFWRALERITPSSALSLPTARQYGLF